HVAFQSSRGVDPVLMNDHVGHDDAACYCRIWVGPWSLPHHEFPKCQHCSQLPASATPRSWKATGLWSSTGGSPRGSPDRNDRNSLMKRDAKRPAPRKSFKAEPIQT